MGAKEARRRELRARVASIRPMLRAQGEELVNALLISDAEILHTPLPLLYMAKSPELSLNSYLNARLLRKLPVALPAVIGKGEMEFRIITSVDQLAPGAFGILEPTEDCPRIAPEDITLALVPGVGFTPSGQRLGQGGGFYDRMLPNMTCPKWGIAWDEQVQEDLPVEAHDQRVDRVIHPATALA